MSYNYNVVTIEGVTVYLDHYAKVKAARLAMEREADREHAEHTPVTITRSADVQPR